MNAKWTAKGGKNHRIIMENSRRIAEIRTGSLRRFRAGTTDSKHPLPITRELLDRDLRASRASGTPTSGIPHIQAAAGRPSLATAEDPCTQQIGDCVLVPFREIQLVCDRLKSESVDQISRIGPLQHGLGVNHWFMGRNPGRREKQRLTMTDAAQS